MLGSIVYMPVLKVKRGEKRALSEISQSLRRNVLPLLEIVERTSAKAVDKHLATSFRGLAPSLQGYTRSLIDVREIESDGPQWADEAFRRAEFEGIKFTPVTGISRTADVASAVSRSGTMGIGIRLTRAEFENGYRARDLESFMNAHGITPGLVDLIVDLGPVTDLIAPGVMSLTQAFLAEVPVKTQWNTLTVTASAFPLSMGVVNRNSLAMIERSEWVAWRAGLYSRRHSLERLPTFGDCVIQHPAGVEQFDFRYMRPSAAIRYTYDDCWLLIKGESTRIRRPGIQFPELATRLVYGPQRGQFARAQHCQGCKMVKDSADGALRLGAAEVWRTIGTIHHITTVVQDDLASLQWP